MEDRDVGELFEYDCRRFQIVLGIPCTGCAFEYENGQDGCNTAGLCNRSIRSDGLGVVAVELEE